MPVTFLDLLDSLNLQLADEAFNGYLPRAIPHELDTAVLAVVRSFQEADEVERSLLDYLPEQAGSVFLAFAERQASLAVRTRSAGALVDAAVAIGLAASLRDEDREVMLVMPVVWHAAALLGVHQGHLFSGAARTVQGAGARALEAFVTRKPEDQTLACMGYREGSDRDGFRFVRDW